MQPRWRLFLSLVALVVLLDQGSKLYVHATFALHESRPVIPNFFALTYVRNPGAAFGLLARQDPAFLRLFFAVITAVAVAVLVAYYHRGGQPAAAEPLGASG
ncbi:MAG: hypothetical protein KatS3mg131_0667 [Candidatus Tectimicrobiota bacterium]|nr:MAG: hypothetical protein KatS3mg131_0667 [Candidatus Tectomicrobia bacterium]